MKTAIVHDWLVSMGGSERCLETFCELFPDATLYTLVYNPDKIYSKTIRDMHIVTSFLQDLPFSKTKYRSYVSLFPSAVESFDLKGYDLVISLSHCVAKGAVTGPETLHLCYCCTPMRYAWDFYGQYFNRSSAKWPILTAAPIVMNYLRRWDVATSKRVNHYIAISKYIREKISKYYMRESEVIYPPVDTDFYLPNGRPEDYYLVVSRMVHHKRIDIAIEACNQLKLPLVVIGDGPKRKYLESIAGPTVRFMGIQPDEVIKRFYARCRAMILPSEEDFGITPLEAQSCGRPVIGYAKGGILETVIPGKTGEFFSEQTTASLVETLKGFNPDKYDREFMRQNALKFSRARFKKQLDEAIRDKINKSRTPS